MAKPKFRLDVLLVQKGLVDSREKAKALIMAGKVYNINNRLDKPGMMIEEDTDLIIKGELHPYVSRGGLKLAKAIEIFKLDFHNKIVADIGASTGGFTDCALQNGASRAYAVDVGYGQLDWKLRNDARVTVLERTNARHLEEKSLPEQVDWVVCDVSFISVIKIFPAMLNILKEDGQVIILIKPQFEAGRDKVGKNGVVKDQAVHRDVIKKVLTVAESMSLKVMGLDYSPLRGPEGNVEFLGWLSRDNKENSEGNTYDWISDITGIVQNAQIGRK